MHKSSSCADAVSDRLSPSPRALRLPHHAYRARRSVVCSSRRFQCREHVARGGIRMRSQRHAIRFDCWGTLRPDGTALSERVAPPTRSYSSYMCRSFGGCWLRVGGWTLSPSLAPASPVHPFISPHGAAPGGGDYGVLSGPYIQGILCSPLTRFWDFHSRRSPQPAGARRASCLFCANGGGGGKHRFAWIAGIRRRPRIETPLSTLSSSG